MLAKFAFARLTSVRARPLISLSFPSDTNLPTRGLNFVNVGRRNFCVYVRFICHSGTKGSRYCPTELLEANQSSIGSNECQSFTKKKVGVDVYEI